MVTMHSTITTTIDQNEKDLFAQTCSTIGTTSSNAIRALIAAFNEKGGFPFDPENPLGFNKETLVAMDGAMNGYDLFGPFKTNSEMWDSIFDEKKMSCESALGHSHTGFRARRS